MTGNLNTPGCIRTFSGKFVNLLDPDPDTIVIEDIAHGLALLNRWHGQTEYPLSVAQHSVECSRLAPDHLKIEALLHDASEAYLNDIASPLKQFLPYYKAFERRMMRAISEKFDLSYPLRSEVRLIDSGMLTYEWHTYVLGTSNHGTPLVPWDWKASEKKFLATYELLSEKAKKF